MPRGGVFQCNHSSVISEIQPGARCAPPRSVFPSRGRTGGTPKNAAGTEMQLAVGPCRSASGRERPRTMSWTETGAPRLGACISPPPFEPINRPTLWPSRLCECPLLYNTSILHCPVANTGNRYAHSAAEANVLRPPTMRPPDQRHREHNTTRSRRVCRGCHSSPSAPRECWPLLSHLSPKPH